MRRNWLPSLLCVLAVLGLMRGITASALWDPHELSVAELGRRIALNLLGGVDLAIPGADNSLPIRADLGRGELPFTSAALGFRLFGLSEWAGRLPLVLWALLGLGTLYAALVRLTSTATARYAVLVLATTPLYFLQARSLLGDAVTLASFTMAWSGWAAAALAPALGPRSRSAFALLGAVGLYAGFWCRGPIVSVAVPALAIGLAARFTAAPSALARAFALSLLPIGTVALAFGLLALPLAAQTGEYSVFVGSALAPPPRASFDEVLGRLAHSAFPWSALAPLALALPWRQADDEAAPSPSRVTVMAALLTLAFALAASAWLSPALGSQVLPAVCCFAVLVACALSDLEERPRSLPLLALSCAALALILGMDLHTYPEKVLSGFGLSGVSLPESLASSSGRLWKWGALALAAIVVLCLFEHDDSSPRFQRTEYQRVLTRLQQLWDGNLIFALLVLEAGLVGFLLLSAISERLVHLEHLDSFGVVSRKLAAGAAVAVPIAVFVPLGLMLSRDAARAVFGRPWPRWLASLSASRPQGAAAAAAVLALAGSLGFYPELAQQVAPKQVFERYRELGRPREPLGMLGEGSVAARYQAGAHAHQLASLEAAFEWLDVHDATERRWLLVRRTDLAELNARFRERHAKNLPILDARSSELLLASNQRRSGERDESPLTELLLDAPPRPQNRLQAVLGNKLEVLGWSVTSSGGQPVSTLTPVSAYRLVIYYRVLAPLSGAWQTFVHIDGFQRRFNTEHEPLSGKYPLALWKKGDLIADATELKLEPNFSPGQYSLYFGLYAGKRRLEVTSGAADGDRIVAGTLQID